MVIAARLWHNRNRQKRSPERCKEVWKDCTDRMSSLITPDKNTFRLFCQPNKEIYKFGGGDREILSPFLL